MNEEKVVAAARNSVEEKVKQRKEWGSSGHVAHRSLYSQLRKAFGWKRKSEISGSRRRPMPTDNEKNSSDS